MKNRKATERVPGVHQMEHCQNQKSDKVPSMFL